MKRNLKIAPTITTSIPGDPVVARLVLEVPDYGSRYHVNKRTVWEWVRRGLPHFKLGPRKTRIPVREADQWVSENFYRQRES